MNLSFRKIIRAKRLLKELGFGTTLDALEYLKSIKTEIRHIASWEIQDIIEDLDDTGGFLIKERELKYWLEFYANRHVNETLK